MVFDEDGDDNKIPTIINSENNNNHVKIVREIKVVESELVKIIYPSSRTILSLFVVTKDEIMKQNSPNMRN